MIEIKSEQANILYDTVKEFLFKAEGKEGFTYEKRQHHIYESGATDELRARYYNESGSAEVMIDENNLAVIEIRRYHPHKHNGWGGLNGTPCCFATIYLKDKNGENKKVWELKIGSGTLYYKAEATSLQLPDCFYPKGYKIANKENEEMHYYIHGNQAAIEIAKRAIPMWRYFDERNYKDSLTEEKLNAIVKKHLSQYNYKIYNSWGSFEILLKDNARNPNLEEFKETIINATVSIQSDLRKFYDDNAVHITRMFGSYILLEKKNDKLEAVKATPIPIKYCPLMIKLLKDVCEEIGGDVVSVVDELLSTLKDGNEEKQTKVMCDLINRVVIAGGYFDTNRPLNSCEANVLFGASETISSAFSSGIVDAAVIVSNNLGTIITTNNSNTQGAVKRMTGLFFTSPSEKIVNTAIDAGIIPVFPYTAQIDQIAGVKKAIELGYKKIAVSVAARDNYLHEKLKCLEEEYGVIIYKFGLCSTGISEEIAIKMRDNADVIWTCASKQVKEHVEPNAIAQVGIKIPVHIMSNRGWEIVSNHLSYMPNATSLDNVELCKGDDKPVILNNDYGLRLIKKRDIKKCNDCPYPCV